MSLGIEMCNYWFVLNPLVDDVRPVVAVNCLSGLSHILLSTLLAMDVIDQILGLARSCCLHLVLFPSTMTGEFSHAHQCGAGLASRAVTFLVTWWATDWWFEFCPYQKVSQVFGTTEGSDGREWYCLLQLFRDMENVVMFSGDAPYYPSYACCQFFFTQLPVQVHRPQ